MGRLVRLGVRLSIGSGRAGAARLALMASGAAVAAFVVLTALALGGVADRQQDRADRIAPIFADPATTAAPPDAPLGGVILDGWRRQELRRIVIATPTPPPATPAGTASAGGPAGAATAGRAASAKGPVPPGVERLPGAGEVVLSPALRRLVASEPLVARRFPQRVVGEIGSDGLVEPDQLLAYVGVDETELSAVNRAPLVGFGDPGASGLLKARTARMIGLLILLTLVAPVLMFAATCARLSATARSQRLAALRLLGLGRRRTQVVNAVETGIVGTAGSVAGLLAWLAWRALVPEVRLGVFSWYADDLRLGPVAVAGALGGLVALSVVAGALGSRSAIRRPLGARREGAVRSASPWRAVPLAAGVVLLALSWTTAGDGRRGDVQTWLLPFGAGLLLSAVGLVLAIPFTSLAVGRLLQRSERPALLLAGARLRHEPAVAARVLAALATALFAAGAAQVVLAAVEGGSTVLRGEEPDRLPPVVNMDAQVPPGTTVDALRPVSDVGVVVRQASLGPAGVQAVVASCADARQATAEALPDCREGRIYRVDPPADGFYGPGEPAPDRAAVDAGLAQAGLPPAAGALRFELLGYQANYVPQVLVPPELAPATAPGSTCCLVAMSGARFDAQTVVAALAEHQPGSSWNGSPTAVDRLDTVRIYSGVIAVGTAAALAIGLVALAVASIDRALERRASLAHLAALGTPPRTIRWALAGQTLPVAVVTSSLAALVAVVGGASYLRWDDPTIDLPIATLAWLVAFAGLAALAATALALLGAVARPRADLLRQT